MNTQHKRSKQSSRANFAAITVLVVTLVVTITSIDFSFLAQAARNAVTPPQIPTVSALIQEGSPLQISVGSVELPNPLEPQVTYFVTNVGGKSICTYSILHETKTENAQFAEVIVSNAPSIESLFKSSQSRTQEISGHRFVEPVKSITLSVDYVEFADGTIWGKDTQKSAEKMAGQRAGGRATKARLLKLLVDKGNVAVLDAISDDSLTTPIPAEQSSQWKEGFRIGSDFVIHRLREAKNRGDLTELHKELRESHDASERRKKP